MREKFLKKLAHLHANHPWRMLAVVVIITIVMGALAGQLTITMRTQDLMPEGDVKVDQFNKIIDEFATATSLLVVVQGDETDIKAFAGDLAPRLLELKYSSNNETLRANIEKLQQKLEKFRSKGDKSAKAEKLESQIKDLQSQIDRPLFQRVDYKVETDFLRDHALMLVKADDLKNTKDLFMDANLPELLTNLNNSMEKEYVGREESISTREEEDGAVQFLDGIQSLVFDLQKASTEGTFTEKDAQNTADKFLFGEPYFLSYDKTALVMSAIPNFTILDRGFIMIGTDAVQEVVDELLRQYPGVTAGLSGDIAREHDEQTYSQQSLGYTTIIAFAAILVLLMISFRMWVAPILAVVNLMIALIWASGAAFLAVGQLNIMTSMFSVILLGLGIDFSIHIISGLTEWRAAGESIVSAMEKTFLKTGKGVITGALTTACAFLALLISRSRGMKEMGLVAGAGLLTILVVTFLFLPVMLVFRERFIERRRAKKPDKQKSVRRDISFRSLGTWGQWLSRRNVFTLISSLAVSAFLIWAAFQIKYDTNFMRMEPKGLKSIALMDTVLEKFDLSMENALYLAEGVEESRARAEAYRDLGTVAMTSDISVFLPSPEEQQERAPHISQIRDRMESTGIRSGIRTGELSVLRTEIERLEMNIMEMQDMAFIGGKDHVDTKCKALVGDPDVPESKNIIRELMETIRSDKTVGGLSEFQRHFAPYFQKSVVKMCSTDPIQMDDLPVSILDQFSNKTRDLFMITIYPSTSLYADGAVLNRFVDDVDRVSPKTTGGPPVAVSWLRICGVDGRNAILLTLVIVFFLLWFDFRKPQYALFAMVPLALGVFWMVGLMWLSGMMLSFMTLMGLPLIIGIGIDDGVHVMHRWQSEGMGRIYTVFSSTGKAILLTSLTTMLAFGSMVFSVFPAWVWFGQSLFIGVSACFLTTVIILPGILGGVEKRKGRLK